MTGGSDLWLRRVRLWLPPLLFLAANLVLWAYDRGVLAGRVAAVERRLDRLAGEGDDLARRRLELAARQAAIAENGTRRDRLYDDWFATPERRLTAAIAEVKSLAARSGLAIRAISYPSESLAEHELARRSFRFSVEGSYGALRQLVYLLELTPSFLTLESITVGEVGSGGSLRADLELSTLFGTAPGGPT